MTLIDWHHPENAKKYVEYCKSNDLYSKAGAALVDLANIEEGETILDFACGTGAATEAIVGKSNATNLIFGVDYSAAQIAQANLKSWPTYVKFLQGEVKDLPRLVDKRVDVVICNCAFWFLNIPELLAILNQIGSPRCRIAFNILGDPLPHHQNEVSANVSTGPDLLTIAREIAVKDYNYIPPEFSPSDSWYERSLADYVQWFEASAFRITCIKARTGKFSPSGTGSLWWEIPVFLTSHLPGLKYEDALSVLRRAEIEVSKSEDPVPDQKLVNYSWIYIAERV